ncbi:hypothetical protein ABIF91_006212 [Bradyrhizobium sp. USDA 241]
MSDSTLRCEALPSATTEDTAAMPMMIPSMVRKARSRCAAIATSAIREASRRRRNAPGQPAPLSHEARGAATAGADAPAVSVRRSETILPSRSSMMRSARAATSASWVTMMIVRPSPCSSFRIFRTSSPLRRSSAPVGSSARMTSAPLISARAIETRCCWPPDSWFGRWPRRSSTPSLASSCSARVRRSRAVIPA